MPLQLLDDEQFKGAARMKLGHQLRWLLSVSLAFQISACEVLGKREPGAKDPKKRAPANPTVPADPREQPFELLGFEPSAAAQEVSVSPSTMGALSLEGLSMTPYVLAVDPLASSSSNLELSTGKAKIRGEITP